MKVGGKTYRYEYDGNGQRTRKSNEDGGYTEYYLVDGLAVAERRYYAGGSERYTMRYLYDESNSPVGLGLKYPGESLWTYFYFEKNVQGDVIGLYRSDYSSSRGYYGTLVARYSYDPYGRPVSMTNASGTTISQTAYNVAAYNPFRYRGYRYDGETGLYYLQSRYYDPETCRFINADSYASTGQGLIGNNMFAYCINNPVRYVDSNGGMATEAVVVATNWWNPLGWVIAGVLVVECVVLAVEVAEVVQTVSDTSYVDVNINNSGDTVSQSSTQVESSDVAAGAPEPPNQNKNKLSLKKISDSLLKKCGLNAHSIKSEYLGKSASISRYDLYYDTKTGIIYILTKAREIVEETHYNIMDYFPMW